MGMSRSRSKASGFLLAGCLLLLPWVALAGPNAGGTLILHASSTTYTTDTSDWCGLSGLSACSTAVVTLPWDPGTPTVFYAIAAFPDTVQPRLKAISFGVDWDSTKFVMLAHGTCADFEVPDGRWPASASGTGQSWTTTQTDPLIEAYWFAGYGYSGQEADSTVFSLIPHPIHGGEFVDDGTPAETDTVAAYGRLGFGMHGALPCPAVGGNFVWVPDGGGVNGEAGGSGESGGGEQSPPPSPGENGLTYVQLATTTGSAFATTAQDLRTEYGLSIVVGMSPDGLLCRTHSAQREALSSDSRVSLVTTESIEGIPEAGTNGLAPGEPDFSAQVWNRLLTSAQTATPPEEKHRSLDKSITPPDSCEFFGDRVETLPSDSLQQTSIYMLGDVGVSLIFMESQQSGPCGSPSYPEDWTLWGQAQVYSEMVDGFRALGDAAPVGTRLSFWIDEDTTLATVSEPIQGVSADSLWINEAMDQLGVSNAMKYWKRMFTLCNERRARGASKRDWWFLTFAVNDSCDTDHRFSDQRVSFGSYNGPRVTLLPYNGSGYSYGLDDVDKIMMHETCHVFGAPDEYYHLPGEDCQVPWGYLRVVNGNGWADSLGTICDGPQRECLMHHTVSGVLCDYTRAQLGWRDSDAPPDGIPDPIDHPASQASMVIGAGDSLVAGDRIDIRDGSGTWAKRLVGSDWSMDRGRMLWDGIWYDGQAHSTGAYEWRRNGGSWHAATLAADTSCPVITDLVVAPGRSGFCTDTLRMLFTDADSRGGRIRAFASLASVPDVFVPIVSDRFYRETGASGRPITGYFTRLQPGFCTVHVQVWDVGDGNQVQADTTYWHGLVAGVGDRRLLVPESALSWGRPNPSAGWIAWDLDCATASRVDLRVVGADGRCIREWPGRLLSLGTTRVLWDGCDGHGVRAASGRYYLVVTDENGRVTSRPVTVAR